MANEQNLKPMNQRSKEEQREIARKGGVASGRARRAKKRRYESWKELGEIFLPMATKEGSLTDIKTLSDVNKKANLTAEEAIFFSLLNKAMKGDIAAIRELFEMTGWNTKAAQEQEDRTENSFINALEGKAEEVWDDTE